MALIQPAAPRFKEDPASSENLTVIRSGAAGERPGNDLRAARRQPSAAAGVPAWISEVGLSRQEGFSLLEVMMALAVAAIALTALLSLGNRTIGIQAEQQNLTRATMLAEWKMAEVEVLHGSGREREIQEEGAFQPPFERYRWHIAFEDSVLPAIRQVTVTVLWGAVQDVELVHLTSFLDRKE